MQTLVLLVRILKLCSVFPFELQVTLEPTFVFQSILDTRSISILLSSSFFTKMFISTTIRTLEIIRGAKITVDTVLHDDAIVHVVRWL